MEYTFKLAVSLLPNKSQFNLFWNKELNIESSDAVVIAKIFNLISSERKYVDIRITFINSFLYRDEEKKKWSWAWDYSDPFASGNLSEAQTSEESPLIEQPLFSDTSPVPQHEESSSTTTTQQEKSALSPTVNVTTEVQEVAK